MSFNLEKVLNDLVNYFENDLHLTVEAKIEDGKVLLTSDCMIDNFCNDVFLSLVVNERFTSAALYFDVLKEDDDLYKLLNLINANSVGFKASIEDKVIEFDNCAPTLSDDDVVLNVSNFLDELIDDELSDLMDELSLYLLNE